MSSTEILGKDYLTREGADIAGYNQLRRLTD